MHQVIGGSDAVQRFTFAGPGRPRMPALLIRTATRRFSHLNFHADRQLGVNPAGTIGLPGRDMDFADQTSEPEAPHLGGRYRPVFISVVAGAAHSEESAALLGPVAGLDEVVNT